VSAKLVDVPAACSSTDRADRFPPCALRHAGRLAVALLALIGSGYAEPVWLISNGFHTAIAVQARAAPSHLARVAAAAQADHLLIGWGAALYYTAPRITPLTFCRTIFLPTASALHVVPVRGPLRERFPRSEILRFEVTREESRQLRRFLDASFKRSASSKPVLLGAGYSPGSRFYAGSETFWFPMTCNVWSARALRRAGVPVSLVRAVAAESLARQVRRSGHREATRRQPLDRF